MANGESFPTTPREANMQAVYDEAFDRKILDHKVNAIEMIAQGVTAVRIDESDPDDPTLIETVEAARRKATPA